MLSMAFELNGYVTPLTYYVTVDSSEFMSYQGDTCNFPFMIYENLSAGDHTLTVTVIQCVNQSFSLDYITYSASFSTVSEGGNIYLPSNIPSSPPTQMMPTSTTLHFYASFRSPAAHIRVHREI